MNLLDDGRSCHPHSDAGLVQVGGIRVDLVQGLARRHHADGAAAAPGAQLLDLGAHDTIDLRCDGFLHTFFDDVILNGLLDAEW